MATNDNGNNDGSGFQGNVFNTYDETSLHAGPLPGPQVDAPTNGTSLHYDLKHITTVAQRQLIQQSGIMAFHAIGDTGTDDKPWHHGNPFDRQDVADMMVEQCNTGAGKPETPCFCYHLGDVIYPHSTPDLYLPEFYQPYSAYKHAIVAIPGNHDYSPWDKTEFGDPLYSYKQNFVAGSKIHSPAHKGRPAMELPWLHWVLDTPLATIIGLAATSQNLSGHQKDWFDIEMAQMDPDKALIVAVHFPPYCCDGSNYTDIRNTIDHGIKTSGRKVDLLLSAHSHNYQRIKAPVHSTVKPPPNANKNYLTDSYTALVNGAGGVSSDRVKYPRKNDEGKRMGKYGQELLAWNGSDYGALTIVVDSNKRQIKCEYNTVVPRQIPDEDYEAHSQLSDSTIVAY